MSIALCWLFMVPTLAQMMNLMGTDDEASVKKVVVLTFEELEEQKHEIECLVVLFYENDFSQQSQGVQEHFEMAAADLEDDEEHIVLAKVDVARRK